MTSLSPEEPWLRRARPWHGFAYGAGLLLAFGFIVLEPSNFDFTRFGLLLLNVARFAALFLIFGVVIVWLSIVPALAVVALFIGGGAGLDPLLAILIVAALLVPAIVRWRGLPRVIGYASLAAVLLFGVARTLSGLPDLVRGF